MMTSAEYYASLNDGRRIFFEGANVEDVPGHPFFGPVAADVGAQL